MASTFGRYRAPQKASGLVGVQTVLVTDVPEARLVPDIDALRALREVGRHGSIASAAAALGISQQALSARMRTLERAMGLQLLVRTPAGSQLTEQGRLVLGWAEDVLDAADRLAAGVRSIRSGISHRLVHRREPDDRRAPGAVLADRACGRPRRRPGCSRRSSS